MLLEEDRLQEMRSEAPYFTVRLKTWMCLPNTAARHHLYSSKPSMDQWRVDSAEEPEGHCDKRQTDWGKGGDTPLTSVLAWT